MSLFANFCLQALETLSFRLARQVANAHIIAAFLATHVDVEWINYPGQPSSPHHELARRYLPKGPGAILTFDIRRGLPRAKEFIKALKIHSFLANDGDSKSPVVHPTTVAHGQLTKSEQRLAGIRSEQIRLTVGTDDEDLIWTLDQAFESTLRG